mmetsp:Transcript_79567/g.257746  ORF Transcript_79567/g.257746 Transcript_79567/m.257746 type:complete len:631 (+) Transcript_79567:1459-3351(+)
MADPKGGGVDQPPTQDCDNLDPPSVATQQRATSYLGEVHSEWSAEFGWRQTTSNDSMPIRTASPTSLGFQVTMRPNGSLREVPPTEWGVTIREIRELIEECQLDPRWTRNASVRTLVEDYVKPKTAGRGVGYALLAQRPEQREVNVMVSHSWNEPAEEFLEALERTVEPGDMMFVCALSMFQNEDGSGPSIAEQLGDSAQASPFYQVLEHIQRRGESAGWRWRKLSAGWCWGSALAARKLPMYLLFGAVLLLWLPLALSWKVCTCDGLLAYEGEEWQHVGHVLPCRLLLGACVAMALAASACWVANRWLPFYRGRMVAVPNTEDDLYSRLWCVYEMFVAMERGVPVQLARTMASAGQGSCREAKCSSPVDEVQIREEIQQACGGYITVDRAVSRMLRPQWASWFRIKMLAVVVFVTARVDKDDWKTLLALGLQVTEWACSCWLMAVHLQGRFTTRHMLLQVGHLAVIALILLVLHLMFGSGMSHELMTTSAGILTVQSGFFLADYFLYRVAPRSRRIYLVHILICIVGLVGCNGRNIRLMSMGTPYVSMVLFLGYLISGPWFVLALHLLDRQFGIVWVPEEEKRLQSASEHHLEDSSGSSSDSSIDTKTTSGDQDTHRRWTCCFNQCMVP